MQMQSIDELRIVIQQVLSEHDTHHDIVLTTGDNVVIVEERLDGRKLWALHIGDHRLGFIGTRTDLALDIIMAVGNTREDTS